MGYTGDPYPKMTGNGFRQLASTGLYELQFSQNLIEIQLAHLEQSSVKKNCSHNPFFDNLLKRL